MPIEKDLKQAYSLLYDKRDIEKALELYDNVLKQDHSNLNANVYKSACLEKLYFRSSSWHNEETLQAAHDFLQTALNVAERRGDRSKIGFVYFRLCIHYYNCKKYGLAKEYLDKTESFGFNDDTLPMWKHNIDSALKKHGSKAGKVDNNKASSKIGADFTNKESAPEKGNEISATSQSERVKTDWYQSSNTVTISLFIKNLPKCKDDVSVTIKASLLDISFFQPENGSEFQFSIKLSHDVDPNSAQVSVFTKKLEVTLSKLDKHQWKSLEKNDEEVTPQIPKMIVQNSETPANDLSYPSSSKKAIDWSKIDIDSDEEESKSQSADAFFQQIYKGADEDTKRAMMKSFIESNGTSLSTNWDEVSKGQVEPALPEGVEIKKL
ncbi:unnamed protein product [Kluyveromyces dobzhanskii CBS 2104]|uniref:WGS project CCBQ000000000 data, contig 00107 n=1 Tax=Kluyveromyces dobzhanskii CBS 2104 TaxID=1427455 RepID=A0A0A8L0L5_9SACH|nr:unnamed protein product [Kluyveromyces dobzhanskii CBS 2104]